MSETPRPDDQAEAATSAQAPHPPASTPVDEPDESHAPDGSVDPDASVEPGGSIEPDEIVPAEPVEPEEDSELVALRAQFDANQARLRAVSKAYTDLKEEMAAFRSRVEAQAKYKEKRRAFEVVKAFFDPVQNLGRSVSANATDLEGLLEGLGIVNTQFTDALARLGLAPVPGVGHRFNPNVHEALALTPVDDPEQDGVILHVHVDGYQVDGKVLQAAQVVVGKHEAPPAPAVVIEDHPADEAEVVEAAADDPEEA